MLPRWRSKVNAAAVGETCCLPPACVAVCRGALGRFAASECSFPTCLKLSVHRYLQAATAGHGWWPVGLADALQGLTHLSLCRNAVKALPPELSRLTALRELDLKENMLGNSKPLAFV